MPPLRCGCPGAHKTAAGRNIAMSSSSAPSKPAAASADSAAASKRSAEARGDDAKRRTGDDGDDAKRRTGDDGAAAPKFDIQDNNGRILASFAGERQAYDVLLRYRVVKRSTQDAGTTRLPEHMPTCLYDASTWRCSPCHECARLTAEHMEVVKAIQLKAAVNAAPQVDPETGDRRGSKGWHDKYCKGRMRSIPGMRPEGSDDNYECPACRYSCT
jgi:hypothetical protein